VRIPDFGEDTAEEKVEAERLHAENPELREAMTAWAKQAALESRPTYDIRALPQAKGFASALTAS